MATSKICLLPVAILLLFLAAVQANHSERLHDPSQRKLSRARRQISVSRIVLDSWANCENPTRQEWPIHLTDLMLSNHPVSIPGRVTVKLEAKFNRDINTFVAADINIMRDVLIFRDIEIPCFNVTGRSVGSCEYSNICSKRFLPNFVQCDNFNRCRCMVPAREPHTLMMDLQIPKPPKVEQKVEAKGIYKITVRFFDQSQTQRDSPLMCVKSTAIVE